MRVGSPRRVIAAALLALAMLAAACQATVSSVDVAGQAPDSVTPQAGERTDSQADASIDEAVLATTISKLDDAYARLGTQWPGFVPSDHPVVLAWRNRDNVLIGAVALHHPSPGELGRFEDRVAGSTIGTVHVVTELNSDTRDRLERVMPFDFSIVLGGADSFALNVERGELAYAEPDSDDFGYFVLHELFHRHQQVGLAYQRDGAQDIGGYPLDAENVSLALLEDRALAAAVSTSGDDQRDAARHFAALRLLRLDRDARIVLDNDQELTEGSARYIEHLIGGSDPSAPYSATSFGRNLLTEPLLLGDEVLNHYAFGRFYASGAAIYYLLEELGDQDPAVQTEGTGIPPALLLADLVGVDEQNMEGLVDEARDRYDPRGIALDEVGDALAAVPSGRPSMADALGDGPAVLTPEETACIEEQLGPITDGPLTLDQATIDACGL